MTIKALITTLAVLGSTSSLAIARPITYSASASGGASLSFGTSAVRDHRNAPTPVRDHVRPRWDYERSNQVSDRGWTDNTPDYRPRAQLLADGLTYNVGEYRKDIVLEGRGRFNSLRLDEESGSSFIKEVRIEFIGGAVQSIPVNQTLFVNRSMTFDLDGNDRAINRIFVYRADGNNMNVGFRSPGEFSVSAM